MGECNIINEDVSHRLFFCSLNGHYIFKNRNLNHSFCQVSSLDGFIIQNSSKLVIKPFPGSIQFLKYIFNEIKFWMEAIVVPIHLIASNHCGNAFFVHLLNPEMITSPKSGMHSVNKRPLGMFIIFQTIWIDGVCSITMPGKDCRIIIGVTGQNLLLSVDKQLIKWLPGI